MAGTAAGISKVVVHFLTSDGAGNIVGEIVTAYPTPQIKRGETRRRVVCSYDRASGTLMVHFSGRGRPAVSVPAPGQAERDDVFLRIDTETDEVVGLQIEDFLRLYLRTRLDAFALIDRAELRGITQEEVARYGEPRGQVAAAPAALGVILRDLDLAS